MATTTQDEELLIIQDEAEEADDSAIFNFNFTDEESSGDSDENKDSVDSPASDEDSIEIQLDDQSTKNDLIQVMDTSTEIKDEKNETTIHEAATQDTTGEINQKTQETLGVEKEEDFSFDISLGDETNTKDEILTPNKEGDNTGKLKNSDDVDVFTLIDNHGDKTNTSVTAPQEESSGDLNEILTDTIIRLESRKKAIGDTTSTKEQRVQQLKGQIGELETQVAEIEADITSLGLEAEKIDSNISKLEDMKLNPVKEHNTKRVAKK